MPICSPTVDYFTMPFAVFCAGFRDLRDGQSIRWLSLARLAQRLNPTDPSLGRNAIIPTPFGLHPRTPHRVLICRFLLIDARLLESRVCSSNRVKAQYVPPYLGLECRIDFVPCRSICLES